MTFWILTGLMQTAFVAAMICHTAGVSEGAGQSFLLLAAVASLQSIYFLIAAQGSKR